MALAGLMLIFSPAASTQLLVVQEAQLLAGDAETEDHFGRSVSVDAGSIAIGVRDDDAACPLDPDCNSGSVFVFTRVGTGWIQQQKLTALDASQGDDFGESVALLGDTLIVGAPGVDAAGNNSGAVYVFQRVGTIWAPQGPRLIPAEVAAEDCFGGAVDLDQDRFIAGARFHDNGALADAGGAYVYSRAGSIWTQEDELLASDAGLFDWFGASVDVSGDRVVVGAPKEDELGPNSGSAYVFLRSGTNWSEEAKLTASSGSGSDEFGSSVSLDSDRIVIGAPFADRVTRTPGAAYVFERAGTVWNETATLLSADFSAGDRFGSSVDNRSGTIVVGSPRDNHVGVEMGSCYVFELTGTTWLQESKLIPFGGELGDEFGLSVSTDGFNIGVGSWLDQDTAGPHQGSAYAFLIKRGAFKTFCFGDGGDQMGCKDCPCSNNSKQGSLGGCLNSSGLSGRIGYFGVPSVSNDTLRFEALSCSPQTFALLTAADNQLPAMGMCPPGSGIVQVALLDGLRCAGGNFQRHGTRATDSQGDVGITNNGWGPPSGPPIGIIAQGGYSAGQTRHFQIIYREDSMLGCGTALNTTNAVSVMFQL